ncbi:enoyl-CoA hydratase/isomerase family protein [Nakamurella silvestris]|nr:enoyl-CoA hydratase/isomerase family protein [Nakamurella silvestris]
MSEEVLVSVADGIGRLTLNRPEVINALSHRMVEIITEALDAWAEDDAVRLVLLTGEGDRGLCAGGDIRAIYEDARNGTSGSLDFWREEYRLNNLIATYPKPYVCVMHGFVLGGGVGISAHGSHRIVTGSTQIAMPEVTIGFVPDVGGTHLLSRRHRELGVHAALTSGRLGPADAITVGLADHYVPVEQLPAFNDALAGGLDSAVAAFAVQPPAGSYPEQASWIDTCYAADTVEEILERLDAAGETAAASAATKIRRASPVAVKVTLRALREAAELDSLTDALNAEYGIAAVALRSHDFPEGVRAQIVDKDRTPSWQPPTLAEVDDAVVASYFAPTSNLPFP